MRSGCADDKLSMLINSFQDQQKYGHMKTTSILKRWSGFLWHCELVFEIFKIMRR